MNTNNDANDDNNTKNLIIPSLIFSLEKNDLSFSNKKINFKKIIEDSVITIDFSKKKIDNVSDKKKIKEYYNLLKKFIDFDEEHYNLLDTQTYQHMNTIKLN